jgi:cysteine dioxygenase
MKGKRNAAMKSHATPTYTTPTYTTSAYTTPEYSSRAQTKETTCIKEICNSLTEHTHALSVEAIRALLQTISLHTEELASFERFDDTSYCRNRIFRNALVDLLLLCWKPGQRTPIHDHSGSTCGVYIVRGEATEIGFSPSGVGLLIPTVCSRLQRGEITVSVDSDAHMVANFAPQVQELVTPHCYSPPLNSMRVFSEQETFLHDYQAVTSSAATSEYYHIES